MGGKVSTQPYQQALQNAAGTGATLGSAYSGYSRPSDDIRLSIAEQEIRHLRATLTALLELINVADAK